MAVDPQLQPLLDLLAGSNAPRIHELEVAEARALMAAMPSMARAVEVAAVRDLSAPGPNGEIPVRVYTPPGSGPFPLLVWFHGGGWALGSLEQSDATARALCAGAGCVTASVDYRLAPEHPFPEPLEDCYAALCWAVAHADELHADASRTALGGDSAGGNLAAASALLARELDGPDLCLQLLVYPVTDFDNTTRSMVDNAEGYLLTAEAMSWFYDQYANPAQRSDWRAAPLRSDDLSRLPAALVITAEFDPLRDEGEAYGRRLADASVPAVVSRYDGMIHGFFAMTAHVDRARDAEAEAVAALRRAFGQDGASDVAVGAVDLDQ